MNFEINGKGVLYDVNDGNDNDDGDVGDDVNSLCQEFVCFFLLCSSLLISRQLSERVSLGRSREGFASLAAFARWHRAIEFPM